MSIASIRLLNSWDRKNPTSQSVSDLGSKVSGFQIAERALEIFHHDLQIGTVRRHPAGEDSRTSLNDTVMSATTISGAVGLW
jgi:hypothetical protein